MKRRVLLIGWDGADWQHINPLLEEGLLPTLDGLINRGVMGNLATLQPILSPMLWNSVATGKLADKHGVHGFVEPDPANGGARPFTSTSRKVKAIWNMLTQSGLRSNVVGWWASHPAEPILGNIVTNAFNGVKFQPEQGWKIPAGTVHPPEIALDLARFKVFPNELTHEHVFPFIPHAERIDQKNDQRIQSFAKILSDTASIHAVTTTLMAAEPWDFTAVYYDAIDHFSHAFMSYHPPRLPWIAEEDFELYRDVIRGAYRFHDMMLERLLQLAGPDATIILCSDHGFESGAQRPHGVPREPAGPAIWHRQYGIFVAAGPGIRRDERVYGASLIDLCPTLLTLFDLPIGEDMDGRPLVEIFEQPPEKKSIPSWDDLEGEAGMHANGSGGMDRDQSQELMQQFAALGYIEDPGANLEKQAESAEVENLYNVARTLGWKGKHDEAIRIFEQLVCRRPWEDRFLMHLASAYFHGRRFAEAENILRAAYDVTSLQSALVELLWAKVQLGLGRITDGLVSLRKAAQLNPTNPGIHSHLGDVHLRLRQWDEAKSAYQRSIELDSDHALGWLGLSTVARHRGDNQATVDAALHAVGLLHRLPGAHFNLGVALARSGELDRAISAFETAIRFQPNSIHAHRFLAVIYRVGKKDPERAKFHRQAAAKISRAAAEVRQGAVQSSVANQIVELPAIPSPAERTAILLRERPDPVQVGAKKSGKCFVIVSGLPRSGTSVMMQMLAAGGINVLTDGERVADTDNPRGYFEWEPIKQIGRNPALLDDDALQGNAIKCISMLLPHLPAQHDYKVIFMMRPIEEVVLSQHLMIERLGTDGAELDKNDLRRGLQSHRTEILQLLSNAPHFEFIEVDYPALVTHPEVAVAHVVEFLGQARLPRAAEMAAVIDPALHRRRQSA